MLLLRAEDHVDHVRSKDPRVRENVAVRRAPLHLNAQVPELGENARKETLRQRNRLKNRVQRTGGQLNWAT